MFTEINHVMQHDGEYHRRIFISRNMDLYIWTEVEKIVSFQLCYDKRGKERAVTWKEKIGFYHEKVDTGEAGHGFKKKPILESDGVFDYKKTGEDFLKEAGGMEDEIKKFIYNKINSYGNMK